MKKSPKKGDSAQRAWQVVQEATGQSEPVEPKDERAVETGRQGGEARAKSMSAAKRSAAAKKAAQARWGKVKSA